MVYEFISKSGEKAEIDLASEQLYGGEEVLWWHSVEHGVFKKTLKRYWFITNLRVCRFDYDEGVVKAAPIKDLEVIVKEKRRSTSTQRIGVYHGKMADLIGIVGASFSRAKSQIIGDVMFIREGQALLEFTGVSDPDGIKRLVEVLKKGLKDVEVRALTLGR